MLEVPSSITISPEVLCLSLYLFASYATMFVMLRRQYRAKQIDDFDMLMMFVLSFFVFPGVILYGLGWVLYKILTFGIDRRD